MIYNNFVIFINKLFYLLAKIVGIHTGGNTNGSYIGTKTH